MRERQPADEMRSAAARDPPLSACRSFGTETLHFRGQVSRRQCDQDSLSVGTQEAQFRPMIRPGLRILPDRPPVVARLASVSS